MSKKRARPSVEWTIMLDDSSGLRSVLDAVHAISQKVFFRVAKIEDTGNYMLMFDGADVGMSCVVTARLHIDNVVFENPKHDDEELSFCVDCKQLKIALNNPTCSHGSFSIQYYSDATIHCRMQDPDQLSHEDNSILNTYVDARDPVKLDDMKFDIKLEIDVVKLREMIKKARDSHAEQLRIQIYLRNDGLRQCSLVVFSVSGDSFHSQKFSHETAREEDGSLRVRAAADGEAPVWNGDDEKAEYEAVFPVHLLEAFIKILPHRMVAAMVTPGKPLMISHTLGGGIVSSTKSDSTVRFLIAPINEDE